MHAALITSLLLMAPPDGGGLQMNQAVEIALKRAPLLEARAQAEVAAKAKSEVVRSAYLPRISFDATYLARTPQNNLPIELPALPGIEPIPPVDDVHHLQVGLSAGYRVFDLSRGARLQAAEAGLSAEEAETAARRSDLGYAVRATFLAAVYARDVRDIADASLELAKRQLHRVQLRAAAGVDNEVAVAQAKVRLAGLGAQKRRAETELLRHRARLASWLGQDELPALAGDLEKMGGAIENQDLSQHPELRKLAAQARASKAQAKGKSRGIIPTITIMGSAKLQYPRALVLELGPVYEAGIALAWPVFNGFARENEVAALEAQAELMNHLSAAKQESLTRSLIDITARDKTAAADLRSAEEILEQTQIYLRVARGALLAGAGTQLDVHTAELGLDRATMAKKKALFDRALLRAQALHIHGRVLEGEL